MNAAMAHARGLALMLQPTQSTTNAAWSAIGLGAVSLLVTSRNIFADDVSDQLVGALWLVFCSWGLARLRQACWSPGRFDAAPLPIGAVTARAVELLVYLAVIVIVASLPVAAFGHWGDPLKISLLVNAPPFAWVLGGSMASLAICLLLLLPLVVATAAGEARHGPVAILRMLLPWLPIGVAAVTGQLDTWAGLGLTLLASWIITGALVALRRTGWEDWQPSLPDFSRSKAAARVGLPPHERLATDYHGGLARGLGGALVLTVLAWIPLYANVHGWLPQGYVIFAILLLPASFLWVTQTTLRVPWNARNWSAKRTGIPWQLLPLPAGDFQLRTHAHQAIGLTVVALANSAALGLTYLGVDLASDALVPLMSLTTVEIVLPMLLVIMPAASAWEARHQNSPRPPGPAALVVFILLAVSSFSLALALGTSGLAGLAEAGTRNPMTWSTAAHRMATALGPGLLACLGWLAAGRVLVTRDVAAQRQGCS